VARGDHGTVAAHRETIAERAPELLGLYDSLVQATRVLAESQPGDAPAPPSDASAPTPSAQRNAA
jgi:hypothetical protein